jgi:hypothetical protein
MAKSKKADVKAPDDAVPVKAPAAPKAKAAKKKPARASAKGAKAPKKAKKGKAPKAPKASKAAGPATVVNPSKEPLHFSVQGESHILKPGASTPEPAHAGISHQQVAEAAVAQLSAHGVHIKGTAAPGSTAALPEKA